MCRFRTGYVLSEQPPVEGGRVQDGWWDLYGGKPDVIGSNLSEVVSQILTRS